MDSKLQNTSAFPGCQHQWIGLNSLPVDLTAARALITNALDGAASTPNLQLCTKHTAILCQIALFLGQSYERSWRLTELDDEIALLRTCKAVLDRASSGVPQDCTDTAGDFSRLDASLHETALCGKIPCAMLCAAHLGDALDHRYRHSGSYDNVKEENCICDWILAFPPESNLRTAHALNACAVARRTRFEKEGAVDDLNEALRLSDQAVRQSGKSDARRARYLTEYGRSLKMQFHKVGDVDDLTKAISLGEEALQYCPPGHLYRDTCLSTIATFWVMVASVKYSVEHLKKAQLALEEAIQLRPLGHRDRLTSINSLGVVHLLTYQLVNDRDALSHAISCFQDVFEHRAPEHSEWHLTITNLTLALRMRAAFGDALADLNLALSYGRMASNVNKNSPAGQAAINNLAGVLQDIFAHTSDLSAFEEAVQLHREVLRNLPPNHASRPTAILDLAHVLHVYFLWTEDQEVVSEAINLCREALSLVGPGNSIHLRLLVVLGQSYLNRFESFDLLSDLESAIDIYQTPIDLTNQNQEVSSFLIQGSIDALVARLKLLGNVQDFSKIAQRLQDLDHMRGPNHAFCYRIYLGYGKAYYARYFWTRDEADVKLAIDWLSKALDELPDGLPFRSEVLMRLGAIYLDENTSYGNVARGLNLLCESLEYSYQPAVLRLSQALPILDKVDRRMLTESKLKWAPNEADVLHAYTVAVGLLPRIAYFGLDLQSRLKTLGKSEPLSTSACLFYLRTGHVNEALEILEHGRAVFWSQFLRARTSFDGLPIVLQDKLREAARQLEPTSYFNTAEDDDEDKEERAAKIRRVGLEFESLIEEARAIPEFDRFLLPDTAEILSQAAIRGPVMIFTGNSGSCYGILISAPSCPIQSVPLPAASLARWNTLSTYVNKSASDTRNALRSRAMVRKQQDKTKLAMLALEELWKSMVKPVANALSISLSNEPNSTTPRRLFICATGVFAHIPVHAAGDYSQADGECLSDRFIPSYIPTLGALLNARRSFQPVPRTSVKTLLAAVPAPFRWSGLPYADAEAQLVREILPTGTVIECHASPDGLTAKPRSASAQAVLDNLPAAHILHLCCHGHQDPEVPLNSGFIMKDRMLTVANLMALRLSDAFLAFLSACETAKGDSKQPDQAIHLAATMLFAGFKSVIGTMWSMDDVDGPRVAKAVYEHMFSGDGEFLDPDAVPYALNVVVKELRTQGLHPSRWATYVHLGL